MQGKRLNRNGFTPSQEEGSYFSACATVNCPMAQSSSDMPVSLCEAEEHRDVMSGMVGLK